MTLLGSKVRAPRREQLCVELSRLSFKVPKRENKSLSLYSVTLVLCLLNSASFDSGGGRAMLPQIEITQMLLVSVHVTLSTCHKYQTF